MKDNRTKKVTLGPRMEKAVKERLANTLIYYRYSSPELIEIESKLLAVADNPEDEYISSLTTDDIVNCLRQHKGNCMIAKKLCEVVLHDIELRSKHYRTWIKEDKYLTDTYVESYADYSEKHVKQNILELQQV